MFKINLEAPILNVKGKQLEGDDTDEKGRPIKTKMTIREYLLIILGTRFPIQNSKEPYWTTEIGIIIANTKNKELIVGSLENLPNAISTDKAKFLKRIIENNKATQQGPMGKTEIEIFFPYELGQLLKIFEGLEKKEE